MYGTAPNRLCLEQLLLLYNFQYCQIKAVRIYSFRGLKLSSHIRTNPIVYNYPRSIILDNTRFPTDFNYHGVSGRIARGSIYLTAVSSIYCNILRAYICWVLYYFVPPRLYAIHNISIKYYKSY